MTDVSVLTLTSDFTAFEVEAHGKSSNFSRIKDLINAQYGSKEWKARIREELVREYILEQDRKKSPIKSFFKSLFGIR